MNKLILCITIIAISFASHGQSRPVQRGEKLFCDYAVYGVWQPTEECAKSANRGFERMMEDPQHAEIYNAKVEELKSRNARDLSGIYWTLFRSYSSAYVLFQSLNVEAKYGIKNQRSIIFSYGSASPNLIPHYALLVSKYDLVIAMLNDRETRFELTDDEIAMRDVSKKRSECLVGHMNFMRENIDTPVDNLDIVNDCFN